MNKFEDARQHQHHRVVTDAARFIGVHPQEALRGLGPRVTGLDIFSSALGSADDAARTNATNVTSFLNMRFAACGALRARLACRAFGTSMNRHLLPAVNNTKFGGYRV